MNAISFKIGHFSESYHPCVDGVSRFLQDFLPQMENLGFRCFTYTSAPSRVDSNVRRIKSLPFPFYPDYWISYLWIHEYPKRAIEDAIDIAHIHTPFMAGIGGILGAMELRIPILGTFHTNIRQMASAIGDTPLIHAMAELLNKVIIKVYNKCNLVTTSTNSQRDFLLHFGLKVPVEVVPIGINISRLVSESNRFDFRAELGIPRDAKVVLYLGRLTVDKGVYLLLESFKEMRKLESYLIFAGTGPELNALRRESLRSIWKGKIKVLGYVNESLKASLISQSDIVVLPSKGETFGISLAEGMALGKVAIASNKGGLKDWVENGFNGLIFDYDKEGDLRRKLEYALESDLSDLSRRAAIWASETIDIRITARRFEKIYRELLEKR